MKRLLFAVVMIFMVTGTYAEQMMVDINTLSPQVRKMVSSDIIDRDEKARRQENNPVTVKQATEWAGVAQGIGMAVKELCKSLNVELNDFIQTPAGKIILFVLLWKLIGSTIASVGLCIGMMIAVALSFRYFHARRFRKLKDGTYVDVSYPWQSTDAKAASTILHVLFMAVLFIVAVANM